MNAQASLADLADGSESGAADAQSYGRKLVTA
jgi:hypothetical protein